MTLESTVTDIAVTQWDVDAVRAQFTALRSGTAFLDGPGGTQFPQSVIDAMTDAMGGPLSNDHGQFDASRRSEGIVDSARAAIADIVGGDPRGVVLGPNMTTLTQRFAQTLEKTWAPGDNVVVSQLDHDADIRPWVQAAARAGVTVRWARLDPANGELPADQYGDLVDARTRLVAITGASNALGTRPDLATIIACAHASGALAYVDGVHLTPHVPVDMRTLGADFYACSAYKFCGPHVGAVTASPDLLASLDPDRLAPAPTAAPDKFEWGTGAFEQYAGVAATADFLASLGRPSSHTGAGGAQHTPRRARITTTMHAMHRYETALADRLRAGLEAIHGIRIFGQAALRTPTVSFRVDSVAPVEVAAELGRHGICVWDGDFYAYEAVGALGLRESGGLVRVGIAPYTNASEVDRLLEQVERIAAGGASQ